MDCLVMKPLSRTTCMEPSVWRRYMAEQIAFDMDMEAWEVDGIYLFGSTESGEAGAGSDIDLIIHTNADAEQMQAMRLWLDGWNRALCSLNFMLTGYQPDYLLDVHFVDDQDIRKQNSFAIKTFSSMEPAEPLRILRRPAV